MTCTIVIPAHNEEKFLAGLLQSVASFGPTGADVVVVDNGSTDSTDQIASSFGAQVLRVDQCFPGVARNLGADISSADVLVFLDADVELTADWKAAWSQCVSVLETEPRSIFGSVYDVSKTPSWIERVWFAPMRSRRGRYAQGGNLIIGRELFLSLRGFDERLETGEDVDLCSRASRSGAKIFMVDGLRVHHEGYPKTFRAFIRRERWHGKGDVASFRRALTSRVLLASAAFVALQILTLGLLIGACYDGDWMATAISALSLLGLCVVGARRAANPPLLYLPAAMLIMCAYYTGRILSVVDVLKDSRAVRELRWNLSR